MPYKDIEKRRKNQAKWFKEKRAKVRKEIFKILGDSCKKCGYRENRSALCVDHVNGGGCKEARKRGGSYMTHILKKIKSGSEEYQILCCNCNQIKKEENNENAFIKH